MDSQSLAIYEKLENSLSLDTVSEIMELLSGAIINYIVDGIKSNDIVSLKRDYNNFSKIASSLRIKEDEEHRKAYLLGYIKSNIDLLNIVENKSNENLLDSGLFKSYTHLKDLLHLLYHENSLSHQDVAKALQIKGSNLSNFINRIEPYRLLETRKIGKNKYYYISPNGRTQYLQYYSKQSEKFGVESYTNFTFIMLDSIQNEISAPFVDSGRAIARIVSSYDNPPISKPKAFMQKLSNLFDTIDKQKKQNRDFALSYYQTKQNHIRQNHIIFMAEVSERVKYEINP